LKILFADDEKNMRLLVADFLEMEGYEVLLAADGEEALQKFCENPDLSLVILDIMMPRMNGMEVLEEIRERCHIPVIMLTAKSAETDELEGFQYGADEYISRDKYEEIMKGRASFLLEERPHEFIDFYEGIKNRTLKPKVLVRYNREAYCLRAANLRITFDRNLSTGNNNLDLFDRNGSFTCPESNLMILEIKYDGFFPSHIKSIVQSNASLRSSASKYVLGRKFNYLY